MKYLKSRVLLFGILTMTNGMFQIILLLAAGHGHPFANANNYYYLVSPVLLVLLLALLILFILRRGSLEKKIITVLSPIAAFIFFLMRTREYIGIMLNQELSINPLFLVLDLILFLLVLSFLFDVLNKTEPNL